MWQNGAVQLSIGAAIRDRRNARGWTQAELGEHAGGVNKETVNRAELGANVTVDTLLKLARALDVELDLGLRESTGKSYTARDSLSAMSPPVSPLVHSQGAPGKESVAVPFPTFPTTPSHVVLYGLIAALSEVQARQLWRPLLELVEATEKPDDTTKPLARKARQ